MNTHSPWHQCKLLLGILFLSLFLWRGSSQCLVPTNNREWGSTRTLSTYKPWITKFHWSFVIQPIWGEEHKSLIRILRQDCLVMLFTSSIPRTILKLHVICSMITLNMLSRFGAHTPKQSCCKRTKTQVTKLRIK